VMPVLGSALFYLGYICATVFWGGLSVLIAWVIPYRARFTFIIGYWTRFCLWWLKLTCGIRYQIEGLENLPDKPCVVFCRHESTWETLFLQTLLAPQATLIKRELLMIPFFGWAFALLKPISIDRASPRSALKKLIRDGTQRLQDNIWVVLFPEGTRMPTDELGSFQIGGSALACAAGVPITVIAHNAGQHWPAHRFVKHPGTIQVRIAPPIDSTGETSKTLSALASQQLLELQTAINPRIRHPD
jgi:1-acyl-sn-glycerol-3-phosphate acyltransferase